MAIIDQGAVRHNAHNNRIPTPEPQLSSPLRPLGSQGSDKPKRKPTVTPRTFTRFFTPRSSLRRGRKIGASRQILRDITASGSNRKGIFGRRRQVDDKVQTLEEEGEKDDDDGFADVSKKRKRYRPLSPETTPDLSSPLKRMRSQSFEIPEDDAVDDGRLDMHLDAADKYLEEHDQVRRQTWRPIISRGRGPSGVAFARELGSFYRTRRPPYPLNDWQNETSNFFSAPQDLHVCNHVEENEGQAMPFCTTSCNTNSLVAIGDEKGGVRLLESAKTGKPEFAKAHLTFRPHTNAILDLAFSSDDLLLATASGDQTAQVIDMPTQRSTYTMKGHTASLKETRFQPGNSSVIATSSRDGSVQIWDLRCKGLEAPVRDLKVSLDPADKTMNSWVSTGHKMTWARAVNSIANAHASRQSSYPNLAASKSQLSFTESFTKTEAPGRRSDVSVTCLSFLQPGREHLLITGSAANASVKLWDLRTTHSHRRTCATPLSSTRQPESHINHRHYGLNSIALSGDGGRFYTLCRDNTVYAYSTSHLILGHAPELASCASRPRRYGGVEKEGLGPIYGFRHPHFCATSFYVKCTLRPAGGNRSEMLAVASSDACVVVFPTDEQYLQPSLPQKSYPFAEEPSDQTVRQGVPQGLGNSTGVPRRLKDTIRIYQHGSPLVRGHSREVTGVTWTHAGDLVSVGDDYTARCWREGEGGEARELRVGGEGQGRRWGCGWAEVKEGWDDENS